MAYQVNILVQTPSFDVETIGSTTNIINFKKYFDKSKYEKKNG